MIIFILFAMNPRSHAKTHTDNHHLLVCDPWFCTSQKLKDVTNITLGDVFDSRSTSTKTGMTITLHRTAGSSNSVLESGALVLGDQGVCCIDAFDGMVRTGHASLLKAMEQQSISLTNADTVYNLHTRSPSSPPTPSRGTPTADARSRTTPACPPLIQLVVIFVLVDNADETVDRKLSCFVFALSDPTSSRGDRLRRSSYSLQSPSVFSLQTPSTNSSSPPRTSRG